MSAGIVKLQGRTKAMDEPMGAEGAEVPYVNRDFSLRSK
jgi:hypothetical protein